MGALDFIHCNFCKDSRDTADYGGCGFSVNEARPVQEREARVIWAAAVLLFLGALAQSWWSGNYRARTPGDMALGFMFYRNYVAVISILLLLAGLILLLIAKGFLWVIVGAIAYWYVLPVVTVPLLVALKLLPRYHIPWLDKDR
jgi:hypothetical protein